MADTINADMGANVWEIIANEGDSIEEDGVVLILEAMKMEIPVMAEDDGEIVKIHVKEGDTVTPGQPLYDIEAE